MHPALDTLRLFHVNEDIQYCGIEGEFGNLVTLDVRTVRQAVILKEATGFSVHTKLLLLIVFHMWISVNGNETLFEAGRQTVVINQGTVVKPLAGTDHCNRLALHKLLVARARHHGFAGAGVRQLLHRDCHYLVEIIHSVLI